MRLLISALFVLQSFVLFSQNAEGIYVKFGMNLGYPQWKNYDVMFQEFSELRPWLTKKPEMGKTFAGLNIGYGVSFENIAWAEMNYMSQRNVIHFEGVDPSGAEQKKTYTVILRSLNFIGGINAVDNGNFRIGIFAGLTINPVVFKESEDAKNRAIMIIILPLQSLGTQHKPIDDKFWLGTTFGANFQIGKKWGPIIEPFMVLPFWKTDISSTRDALNPNAPSAYSKSDFTSSMKYWGIKIDFFVGASL